MTVGPKKGPKKPLVLYRDTDDFLLAFLRVAKFDHDKACKRVQKLHDLLEAQGWMERETAGQLQQGLRDNPSHLLPGRDREGRQLMVIYGDRMSDIKTGDHLKSMQKAGLLVLEKCIADPETQVNGVTMVEDMSGFSVKAMMKVKKQDKSQMQAGFDLISDCVPLRVGGIHVINQPKYMSILWMIIKPFMKKKLRERIHLHGKDIAALHKVVDPANLPPRFGGTLAYDWEEWIEMACAEDGSHYTPPAEKRQLNVVNGAAEDEEVNMDDLDLHSKEDGEEKEEKEDSEDSEDNKKEGMKGKK